MSWAVNDPEGICPRSPKDRAWCYGRHWAISNVIRLIYLKA